MLFLISPAKTLDLNTPFGNLPISMPAFLDRSETLIKTVKRLSPANLSELMSISPELAQLNYDRFQAWNLPFLPENARPAALTFKGDVYLGLQAETFGTAEWEYAQKHLRILSGLYGLLRPLDLIQPYRLEMGTALANPKGKNLYVFWEKTLTDSVNAELEEQKIDYVINLASQEYSKALNFKKLRAKIVTPNFRERKNGKYQMISFFAKKARGLMCRFAIEQQIDSPEQLKAFDLEKYFFESELSTEESWFFGRESAVS